MNEANNLVQFIIEITQLQFSLTSSQCGEFCIHAYTTEMYTKQND